MKKSDLIKHIDPAGNTIYMEDKLGNRIHYIIDSNGKCIFKKKLITEELNRKKNK